MLCDGFKVILKIPLCKWMFCENVHLTTIENASSQISSKKKYNGLTKILTGNIFAISNIQKYILRSSVEQFRPSYCTYVGG